MSLNDVKIKIADGGLGISSAGGDGIHVKIGVSKAEKNKLIVINSSMKVNEIKDVLGHSPLADAVMDSIGTGASTIYCIPTQGTEAGSIGDVIHSGTGEATYTVSGTPKNSYEIIIEVLKDGGLNGATYRYSIDGGNSFTGEKTIPTDGEVTIENTGIKITFTEAADPENSFKIGDVYSFKTTAPKMSNQEVLDAISTTEDAVFEFEYIHIVGESDAPMWAAVATQADILFSTYFKPVFIICEARNKKKEESISEYVESLITARNSVNNYRLQVVAARAEIVSLDGKIRNSNGAGDVAGLYSKSNVSQSIGEVSEFPLNNVIKLLPEGIEPYISILDQAKFVTFRRYIGLEGFYVTNGRMFAPDGSDYQYAETVRTINKAVREIRKQALFNIQMQLDPINIEGSINLLKEFLQIPLENMTDDKEIASGEVIIPKGQNVLGTSKLKVKVKAVPMAIMREIEIEFGMENPFK
ncbi:DUF2586 family protein [Maledivibacter halophilus]|uniref:Phage tail sheath protein n=1 Tax=Maledivibacter halophilus TaxID=36842 RepID=A0A1T5LX43_9FIRM|nr:DUF2586 family protein [Maledivibacter halophilus]SKC68276.1 Protein of unknown function [Maledivibacter halophilus]SKC71732.1 Protein of unknown function [Maledivibacter halophilus]SKC80169.1 Protein of unknown function [Maledivibacter halophilus]